MHPDAHLTPLREVEDRIVEGKPDMSFTLGSFVHHVKRLPSVSQLVMLGFEDIIDKDLDKPINNYDPEVTYDHVFSAQGMSKDEARQGYGKKWFNS